MQLQSVMLYLRDFYNIILKSNYISPQGQPPPKGKILGAHLHHSLFNNT
jgi:hypothetical protein